MVIQEDFDKAFFQSTFSCFVKEIFAKQIEASKIEMQLLRKIEGKTQSISSHLQIIKYCRKSVDGVDNLLRDMKSYFPDLKINGLYDLFETLFRILVYDIKKISECYLRRFENYKAKDTVDPRKEKLDAKVEIEENVNENLVCICRQKQKEDLKRLEHLDFEIAGIEAQEAAIQQQMNFLIQNLRDQKQKISKINPTSQRAIFQQIQKFCEISKKAEAMFSTFFKNMFDDSSKSNFLQPQKFNQQIFLKLKREIKAITKNKIQKMQEMLNNLYKKRDNTRMEQIKKQVRRDSLKEFQAIAAERSGEKHGKMVKMKHKKYRSDFSNHDVGDSRSNISRMDQGFESQEMRKELENLKKCNKLLSFQLANVKECLKKEQCEKAILDNLNKQLETLFKKRSHELESEKAQLKWVVQKNTKQTIILASQKMEIQQKFHKSLRNTYRANSNLKRCQSAQDKQIQTDFVPAEHPDNYVFEHKPFIPLRSKMKKRTSTEAKQRHKLLQVERIEKNFKEIINKISEYLFEKDEDKVQQKSQIEILLRQEKYNQLISKIKEKLDHLYESFQQKKRKQAQGLKQSKDEEAIKYLSDKKSKKNKRNSPLRINSFKAQPILQSQYNQIGTQTSEFNQQQQQQQQKVSANHRNISSARSKVDSQFGKSERGRTHNNREKMATMMNFQNKFKVAGGKKNQITERSNPGYASRRRESSNFLGKYKENRESSYASRFYRTSQIQNFALMQSTTSTNKRKRSYLLNALFEQLQFDTGIPQSQSKRQSMYKILANDRRKQSIKKSNNIKNKEKDIIKEVEQPNHSSRMSEASQTMKNIHESLGCRTSMGEGQGEVQEVQFGGEIVFKSQISKKSEPSHFREYK